MSLSGKNILLGITGGIAVYKSAQLVRELKKLSANVKVMMTESATKFVAPLTFETLSENPVTLDLFPEDGGKSTAHIELARWSDLIVICPATANTIGKIANGIADNFVTTSVMATTEPVLLCPAMNKEMYNNPIHQQNQEKLNSFGYFFVEPGVGELACGEEGTGRLAEIPDIVERIKAFFPSNRTELQGKNVLVTAGPTEEPIDPVRFISNRSSGKMGFALAEQAADQGANVTLIAGPNQLVAPEGVSVVNVRTALEMRIAVADKILQNDVLLMAAAVSDHRPKIVAEQKIKKNDDWQIIELEKTDDILSFVAGLKAEKVYVGFSIETENELENTQTKLFSKNLDFIVLNNPNVKGAGFQVDTNIVTILDKNGSIEKLPMMSKRNVARKILDKVCLILAEKSN